MRKVLILGGSGLVGRALMGELSLGDEYQVHSTYFKNPIAGYEDKSFNMDVNDICSFEAVLNSLNPEIVISCVRGDYSSQLALHVKTAQYLRENGGRLYFCSTANVFDNDMSRHHYEYDAPESCTDYGQFKVQCEKTITDILHDDACIIRLPQIWGRHSARMDHLMKALSHNERIELYPGLSYNTNTDIMLAKQIHYIIKNGQSGIFHMAAKDTISYRDFYCMLIMGLGFSNAHIYENNWESGCFGLLSARDNGFPDDLKLSNSDVIRHLVEQ